LKDWIYIQNKHLKRKYINKSDTSIDILSYVQEIDSFPNANNAYGTNVNDSCNNLSDSCLWRI